MKKVLTALLLLCLLLTGCQAAKPTPQPSPLSLAPDFRITAEIHYGNAVATALLSFSADRAVRAEFQTPEILTPLQIRYGGGTAEILYDGMRITGQTDRFPQAASVALIADTLMQIEQRTDLTRTLTNGLWQLQGSGNEGNFTLSYAADTGALQELAIEGAGLHAVFRDDLTTAQ